jgi:hypothetical protein
MTLRITGGQTFWKPDAEAGLQNMMTHAKKQLQETGSLEGFSEEYTSTSADGVIKISISSMAARLYDQSAGDDDYLLTFKVATENVYENGLSSGSTPVSSAEDIDAFARDAFKIQRERRWATSVDGTPEELAAYDAAERAKGRAMGYVELTPAGDNNPDASSATDAGADATKAAAEPNGKLAQAQAKNDTANQLVAKLKEFLDRLTGKSKEIPGAVAKTEEGKTPEAALGQLLKRVDTTV